MNYNDLVSKYGTPLFIFDKAEIESNFNNFKSAFSSIDNLKIYYSIKTNNIPDLISPLSRLGAAAEVASIQDMKRATDAKFELTQSVLDGIYKSQRTISYAIGNQIPLINIESQDELKQIDKTSKNYNIIQNIGLRINFSQKTKLTDYEWILNHPSDRFGLSEQEAKYVCNTISQYPNVRLTGLMTHPYNNYTKLLNLAKYIIDTYHLDIDTINFGGGFKPENTYDVSMFSIAEDAARKKIGISRKAEKHYPSNLKQICSTIKSSIEDSHLSFDSVCFEPGRLFMSSAGKLLTKVGLIKNDWIVVDAGTNLLFGGYLEKHNITKLNQSRSDLLVCVNVAGPLLFRNDILALDCTIPSPKIDDVLIIHDVGAYNLARSNQFIFERPCVVLVNNNEETFVKIEGW